MCMDLYIIAVGLLVIYAVSVTLLLPLLARCDLQ